MSEQTGSAHLASETQLATANAFQGLIFDLDDTLVDTYKILIPPTVAKTALAFAKLAQTEKPAIPFYIEKWNELHKKYSGKILFQKVVTECLEHYREFIPNKNLNFKNISNALFEIYLKPDLPDNFRLDQSTKELLQNLENSYHLYLVTQGNPNSQQAKINKLALASHFKMIFIVNTSAHESKLQAFEQILQLENCEPCQILSIGNRLSDEIALAKRLGMKTCHVCTGEHRNEIPQNEYEKADWTIESVAHLREVCQL